MDASVAASVTASINAAKSKKSSDDFVDLLASKGLVKKDGNFKVRLTKDKLVINGKVQPESVAREFRSFLASPGETWSISVRNN